MNYSLLLLIVFFSALVNAESVQSGKPRPNILIVLLDDVGFMGLGAYGSKASTPNIDKIAGQGAQFTSFHTSALCGPSRAMLMTGQDSHTVGMSTLVEVITPDMETLASYSMEWSDDQKTIASRLKENGYQTFVSGKWGIGRVGTNLPNRFGFDRSFVLDATGSSNYRAASYMPIYKTVKWFEDGQEINLPENFYSSRDIVNKMIDYVDEANPDKPFFGYLALQAIHIPVQVPVEYIDKYNDVFDRGWDKMRKERLQKAIELGLLPNTTKLAPTPKSHRKWNDLSQEEKRYWARMMQVNAGMTEAADYHIGRLLGHLDNKGLLKNTIVVVTSDNGAEYNTIGHNTGTKKIWQPFMESLWMTLEGWDIDYDNLGQPGSMGAIGPEWASVSAAPLNLYKFNSSEGGQRVPMVIAGPGIEKLGKVSSRSHVADIAPTLLESAGIKVNENEFYGRSLKPILSGKAQDVWGEDSYGFEVSGNSSLYKGKWKIARVKAPLGDETWHLYDLSVDPGETNNLAIQHPNIFKQLLAEYQSYSQEVGILELAEGETAMKQLIINSFRKYFANHWIETILLIILVVFLSLSFKRIRTSARFNR